MEINRRKIELEAVLKLRSFINQTELLDSEIPDGDKYPSWDGDILVYNNVAFSKEHLVGRIPVQVKGQYSKQLLDKPSYQFDCADLRNYYNDGGVILFLVQIKSHTECQIYYSMLLPLDLSNIIKTLQPNQKKKSLELVLLSVDVNVLMDLCFSFLDNRKKQFGTVDHALRRIGLNELQDSICEYNFSVYSVSGNPTESAFHQPLYLYASIPGVNIDLPLHRMNPEAIIIPDVNVGVYLDDVLYYKNIEVQKTHGGEKILLGSCIQLDLENGQIHYNETGTLRERVIGSTFIVSIRKESQLRFDDEVVAEFNDEITNASNIRIRHKDLLDWMDVMDYYHVKEDLNVADMDELSERHIGILMEAKEHSIVAFPDATTVPNLISLRIANIRIALFAEKVKANTYKLTDLFQAKLRNCTLRYECEEVCCSVYTKLHREDYEKLSNIDFNEVKNDLIGQQYTDLYGGYLVHTLLNIITAFDLSKKVALLDLSEQIAQYLLDNDKSPSNLLNALQIKMRRNDFTAFSEDEVQSLYSLRASEPQSTIIQLGVAILLKNESDIKHYLSQMSAEERDKFMKFPIYNLAGQSSAVKSSKALGFEMLANE